MHNFQLPFVPPTNEVNEPFQEFGEPQQSLNQFDLNNEVQNQFTKDSIFGSKHGQNLYMKNNVLPNWSDSYEHLNNNNMEVIYLGLLFCYNIICTTNITLYSSLNSF